MYEENAGRRNFLKVTGAGIAGTAMGATLLPAAADSPATVQSEYDVRAFGATGDGKTLDTPAIHQAIEAAAAAGGGTVRFPAGTYLCYSIHLKSNLVLYLGPGATIVAADSQPTARVEATIRPSPTPGTNIRTSAIATGRTALSGARRSRTYPSWGRASFGAKA